LADVMQRALAAHRSGSLDEAARLYKQVLRVIPNLFDAIHLLGVLEAQRGQNGKAHRLIVRALKINPNSAEALNNLGNVLWALRRSCPAEWCRSCG